MTREERFKIDMIDEFKQMCKIVEKDGKIIVNKQRMLKALEQEPCDGWTPVSERLPEEYMLDTSSCSDYVFITTEWGDGSTDIGIDRIVDGKWTLSILDDGDTITAWMPLPKPYKPQKSEDINENKENIS